MNKEQQDRYSDELRLCEHLFETVRSNLTGEVLEEILDARPIDILHSGVLLARSQNFADEIADMSASGLTDPAEAGTASLMGIDFQWQGDTTLSLSVTPRISVYYPVLPTFDEVRALINGAEDEPNDANLEVSDTDEQNEEAGETAEQSPDPVLLPGTSPGPTDNSLHELPLKFRRRDLRSGPIPINISTATLPSSSSVSLDKLLEDLSRQISLDPELYYAAEFPRIPRVATADATSYVQAIASLPRPTNSPIQLRASIQANALEEMSRTSGGPLVRIFVALVNETVQSDDNRRSITPCALFNCGFDVVVETGVIIQFEFVGAPEDYRTNRLFDALGSNCVAFRENNRISTETVPLYRQPWTRTTEKIAAKFALLGTAASDPLAALKSIAEKMVEYQGEWDAFIRDSSRHWDAARIAACRADRDAFTKERETFLLGMRCLENDPRLLKAFRFMNDCFALQGRSKEITSWRLFQLVYIISQVPSIAAREIDAASPLAGPVLAAQAKVDVLLFPTGGGKTEAYLGLIVLALFFDRLRGKHRGVTAWMRFPLRMLSLQQLDRLAAIVAEAEKIRSSVAELCGHDSDPFAIGYYVGSGNTPNRIYSETADRIDREGYAPIFAHCPFCGADVSMKMDREFWRLKHVCSNEQCYSNTSASLGSAQGSLPVYIVDNEIYRYRPSVLVSTVDKLAIIAFHRNFSHIIREVNGRCPKHGYYSYGVCIEKEGNGVCSVVRNQYIRNLKPETDPGPSLLIQDEMHLLNEELGTFNGHYEGFLRYSAERLGKMPAKILGATATIQAFERHIFHLYLAEANRFPVPGWQEGETFYSTRRPVQDRRLYTGVLSHRRTADEAVSRCLQVYQREIRRLAAAPDIAMQSLNLVSFIKPQEFRDYLHLYDFSLAYVNRKATGGDLQFNIERSLRRAGLAAKDMQVVESRVDRALMTGMLKGENSLAEVRAVIDQIERERVDTDGERLDILIATSIISHGVDLERINMMCLAGMPSRYAEYVQASSRSSRNHVGLVFDCFNRRDLRECAQYHYFPVNHRFLDRLIEPVPINRFSSFAANKTVPGLLCGLLLCFHSRTLLENSHGGKDLDDLATLKRHINDGMVNLADLEEALQSIILGTGASVSAATQVQTREAVSAALAECWQLARSDYRYTRLRETIHAMSSFRDVDRMVDFLPDVSAGVLANL